MYYLYQMILLIATHNPAKKNEIKKWIAGEIPGIEIVTLDDVGITADPEETGTTFEENAELKAKYYAEKSGLPTLADDGGIVIDALDGEPGVKSKRWLERDASDQELIDYTLERMKDVAGTKRSARFTVVLHFIDPVSGQDIVEKESVEGSISKHQTQTWQPGFPYRAVFKVNHFNKFYDELTPQEHDRINHRRIAIHRLAKKISRQYHSTL